MLLLDGQDVFEHPPRGHVVVPQPLDHLGVRVDGDPLLWERSYKIAVSVIEISMNAENSATYLKRRVSRNSLSGTR